MVRPGDYVRVDHRGVTRLGRVVAVDGRRVSVRVTDDQGSQRVLSRDVRKVVPDVRQPLTPEAKMFPITEGAGRAVNAPALIGSPKEAPMADMIAPASAPDELRERA